MQRPTTTLESQIDLLAALRIVAFVAEGEGEPASSFRALAAVPRVFTDRFPELAGGPVDLVVVFPFLAGFLDDAVPVWQADDSTPLKSGPWTQVDANGEPCVLEATAVTIGGCAVLLLELLGAEFAAMQEIQQSAREQRLAYEGLHKIHEALAESTRRLQRMAEERRAAIEMLRRSREVLEDRVVERTVALVEANERLKHESGERARINDELLSHQQQMRALAEQLVAAEENERRQVAEFLHDRIGQSLALVKMRLGALEKASEGDSLAAVRPRLAEVHQLVEEVIIDTRGLTSDLGTPVLYELGLEEALVNLVRRFDQVHGIAARFEDDAQRKPLAENALLFVYQSVRELLHNVVKHAEASLVIVKVRREGPNLVVAVLDRGEGFDSAGHEFRVTPTGGFGLFNIRERATHLGGSCSIHSVVGQGTEVLLTIPLAADPKVPGPSETSR